MNKPADNEERSTPYTPYKTGGISDNFLMALPLLIGMALVAIVLTICLWCGHWSDRTVTERVVSFVGTVVIGGGLVGIFIWNLCDVLIYPWLFKGYETTIPRNQQELDDWMA